MCWNRDDIDERQASAMRAEITAFLREHGEAEGSGLAAAELIVGELLANVVRYARGPLCVDVDWREGEPTVVVHDAGPGFKVPGGLPPHSEENGRGLYLVSALARRLVAEHVEYGGMRMAATLPLTRRRTPTPAVCPMDTPFRGGQSCPWPSCRRTRADATQAS